jgi:uncharacterized protein involved in exopolysaccharide biosynthesis
MNTTQSPKPDSSNGSPSSPHPHPESDPLFTGHRFTAKSLQRESPGLLRRMARRWWQIAILWLLISVPLINLIHALVKPTYVATSLLQIEPAQADIFAPLKRDGVEFQDLNYLRTQVNVITSNMVLEPALLNPSVVNLPTIMRSQDPRYELREKLKVEILDETNLIRIALELPARDEAVAIVNAVTQAYNVQSVNCGRKVNRSQTESYSQQLEKIAKEIDSK